MKKVLINTCFGGYSLSKEATDLYCQKAGINATWYRRMSKQTQLERIAEPPSTEECLPLINFYYCLNDDYGERISVIQNDTIFYADEIKRDDPLLIETVEELGSEKASGPYADLKIVAIPEDVVYEITDYDGRESVREISRVWF